MSRKVMALDNFLTEEEQRLITSFIQDNIQRSAVKELWTRKYIDWDKSLSVQIPGTAITYRISLKKNNISCAIEKFLIGLDKMLKDENLKHVYSHILEDLERDLLECGASCPCLAKSN